MNSSATLPTGTTLEPARQRWPARRPSEPSAVFALRPRSAYGLAYSVFLSQGLPLRKEEGIQVVVIPVECLLDGEVQLMEHLILTELNRPPDVRYPLELHPERVGPRSVRHISRSSQRGSAVREYPRCRVIGQRLLHRRPFMDTRGRAVTDSNPASVLFPECWQVLVVGPEHLIQESLGGVRAVHHRVDEQRLPRQGA